MLSSRLISILLSSSFIFIACATKEKESKLVERSSNLNLTCQVNDESTENRHIVIAAKSDATLKTCVQNYFRLESAPLSDFQYCTRLSIHKSGKVTAVNLYQSNLPKSLEWCIEQQLWSRNFKGLQLSQSVVVNYPTNLRLQSSDR